MTSSERPSFVSRDYGPRAAPLHATVLSASADEDVAVWWWREAEDDDVIYLQQGYDLISIPAEALQRVIPEQIALMEAGSK